MTDIYVWTEKGMIRIIILSQDDIIQIKERFLYHFNNFNHVPIIDSQTNSFFVYQMKKYTNFTRAVDSHFSHTKFLNHCSVVFPFSN